MYLSSFEPLRYAAPIVLASPVISKVREQKALCSRSGDKFFTRAGQDTLAGSGQDDTSGLRRVKLSKPSCVQMPRDRTPTSAGSLAGLSVSSQSAVDDSSEEESRTSAVSATSVVIIISYHFHKNPTTLLPLAYPWTLEKLWSRSLARWSKLR